jgi:hypothetical protein
MVTGRGSNLTGTQRVADRLKARTWDRWRAITAAVGGGVAIASLWVALAAGAANAAPVSPLPIGVNATLTTTPDTPCTVSLNSPTCTSSNPVLTVDGVFTGNATGCVFTWTFSWGDGATQSVQFAGRSTSGVYFLASHSYSSAQPATYAVTAAAQSVSGGCTILSGAYSFAYVPFSVSTTSVPGAVRGQAYGPVSLQATGITASAAGHTTKLRWARVSLPHGIKLSSVGVLSGTPNKRLVVGSSSVIVRATETVTTLNGSQKVVTKTTVEASIPLTIS